MLEEKSVQLMRTTINDSRAETWALTSQAKNKLAAAQTKMERSMLNITYRDRKRNILLREKAEVAGVAGVAEVAFASKELMCFIAIGNRARNTHPDRQRNSHTLPAAMECMTLHQH